MNAFRLHSPSMSAIVEPSRHRTFNILLTMFCFSVSVIIFSDKTRKNNLHKRLSQDGHNFVSVKIQKKFSFNLIWWFKSNPIVSSQQKTLSQSVKKWEKDAWACFRCDVIMWNVRLTVSVECCVCITMQHRSVGRRAAAIVVVRWYLFSRCIARSAVVSFSQSPKKEFSTMKMTKPFFTCNCKWVTLYYANTLSMLFDNSKFEKSFARKTKNK